MVAAALASHAAGASAGTHLPFASVDLCTDTRARDAAWAELEQAAPATIYQTARFVLPWAETLGRLAGLAPAFVVARDDAGRAVALLALGVRKFGPVTIATPLGGRDANLHMLLLRRDATFTRAALRRLLRDAMRQAGADVLVLLNQPETLGGVANPMALLPHAESPSAAYGTRLAADGEALLSAKLSKDTRKKLRKKEAKLAALGAIRHLVAATPAEWGQIVDVLMAQKLARFRDKGIASQFGEDAMRDFLSKAASNQPPGLELHALLAGERIVATYVGGVHAGRWSGMANSFDADEAVARSSPGDLLLMRIVAQCCERGLEAFDLGVGEARYKAALCDERIKLFDAAFGSGLLGRAVAAGLMARQAAKRHLKRHPHLLRQLRRAIRDREPIAAC